MTFSYLNVCRLCHRDVRHYDGIQYGKRHYAHFACYLDAGKPLSDLDEWQIEGFPFKLINERGLMAEVERLTAGDPPNRTQAHSRNSTMRVYLLGFWERLADLILFRREH